MQASRLDGAARADGRGVAREKPIKSGSRKDKLVLIERDNPLWNDLYETLNA
jgi:predicted GIY-YIG superfamily endonuclease